jgi:hypothetical protein
MTRHTPTIIPFEDEMHLEREHDAYERKATKDLQWLKSCPEATQRVKELIQEKTAQIAQLDHDYHASITKILQSSTGELSTELRLRFVEQMYLRLASVLKKDIARLKRELNQVEPKTFPSSPQLDVEHAKTVQLCDIVGEFTDVVRPSHNSLKIRCPFHEPDHHPSCVIFTATNSFCCFACGAKGDVITFVEKVFGYEFREAVQWLEGRAG